MCVVWVFCFPKAVREILDGPGEGWSGGGVQGREVQDREVQGRGSCLKSTLVTPAKTTCSPRPHVYKVETHRQSHMISLPGSKQETFFIRVIACCQFVFISTTKLASKAFGLAWKAHGLSGHWPANFGLSSHFFD